MGILLVIRTPLCPADAEDCLIDDYGSTTHLSITMAGFALLIALPITTLKARVAWRPAVAAFVSALLANLAWQRARYYALRDASELHRGAARRLARYGQCRPSPVLGPR